MSEKNGGTAFPCGGSTAVCPGMSLRDYFAAKAMQSITSHINWIFEPGQTADRAYKVADAMLRARKVET